MLVIIALFAWFCRHGLDLGKLVFEGCFNGHCTACRPAEKNRSPQCVLFFDEGSDIFGYGELHLLERNVEESFEEGFELLDDAVFLLGAFSC